MCTALQNTPFVRGQLDAFRQREAARQRVPPGAQSFFDVRQPKTRSTRGEVLAGATSGIDVLRRRSEMVGRKRLLGE